MAEIRSQTLMKEAVMRETEEVVASKFENLEARMQKFDSEFKEGLASLLSAIKSMATNSVVGDKNSVSEFDPSSLNHQQLQDQARTRQGYSGVTRLSKIDCPRFSGDKVKEWLFKIEQFFSIDHTPVELKVGLASLHFDDPAATWLQSLTQSEFGRGVMCDWEKFRSLILERFGDLLDDSIAELKNLQESQGICEYNSQFEAIRTRVNLPEDYLVHAYLAGLKPDTQMHVRIFQPKSVKQCFTIGKLYESVHPRILGSDTNAGEDREAEKDSSKEFPVKKPMLEDEQDVLKMGKKTFLDADHVFDEMRREVGSYETRACAQTIGVKGELVVPEYEIEVIDFVREQDNSKACEELNELITHEKMVMDETRIQCFDPGGDLHNSVAELDRVGKTHHDGNLKIKRDFNSLNTINSAATCSELFAMVDEYEVRRITTTCVVEYVANQMPYDRGKVKFINGDVGPNQFGNMEKDQSCLLLLVNLEISGDVSVLCNRENKAFDFSFKAKGLVFDPGKELLLQSCYSKPGLKAFIHIQGSSVFCLEKRNGESWMLFLNLVVKVFKRGEICYRVLSHFNRVNSKVVMQPRVMSFELNL